MPVSQPQSDLRNKSTGWEHLGIYSCSRCQFSQKSQGHYTPPLQYKQVATFPQTCEEQRSLISHPLTAGIISSVT